MEVYSTYQNVCITWTDVSETLQNYVYSGSVWDSLSYSYVCLSICLSIGSSLCVVCVVFQIVFLVLEMKISISYRAKISPTCCRFDHEPMFEFTKDNERSEIGLVDISGGKISNHYLSYQKHRAIAFAVNASTLKLKVYSVTNSIRHAIKSSVKTL